VLLVVVKPRSPVEALALPLAESEWSARWRIREERSRATARSRRAGLVRDRPSASQVWFGRRAVGGTVHSPRWDNVGGAMCAAVSAHRVRAMRLPESGAVFGWTPRTDRPQRA
jgi:hypothetical protein